MTVAVGSLVLEDFERSRFLFPDPVDDRRVAVRRDEDVAASVRFPRPDLAPFTRGDTLILGGETVTLTGCSGSVVNLVVVAGGASDAASTVMLLNDKPDVMARFDCDSSPLTAGITSPSAPNLTILNSFCKPREKITDKTQNRTACFCTFGTLKRAQKIKNFKISISNQKKINAQIWFDRNLFLRKQKKLKEKNWRKKFFKKSNFKN